MKVSFPDACTCMIGGRHSYPLGQITCDVLNMHGTDPYAGVVDILNRVSSVSPEFHHDTPVSVYLVLLDICAVSLTGMLEKVSRDPFYRFSDEPANMISPILAWLGGMKDRIARLAHSDDALLGDIGLEFDPKAFDRMYKPLQVFFAVLIKAVSVFGAVVDACLLYAGDKPAEKPLERFAAYGEERFNMEVDTLVRAVRTASSALYGIDYEIVTLADGTKTLSEQLSVSTLPQFMYHEVMQLIRYGQIVRKCRNCGSLFVQYGDRVIEYCGNIPGGETRPCSVIGPARQFNARLKHDPIMEVYTRTYKKYMARKRSGAMSDARFKLWAKKAKELRAQAYNGHINGESFYDILEEAANDIMST